MLSCSHIHSWDTTVVVFEKKRGGEGMQQNGISISVRTMTSNSFSNSLNMNIIKGMKAKYFWFSQMETLSVENYQG